MTATWFRSRGRRRALAACLTLLVLIVAADEALRGDRLRGPGPLGQASVELTQSRDESRLRITSPAPLNLARLDPDPRIAAARRANRLCLEIEQAGRRARSCLGQDGEGPPILARIALTDAGEDLGEVEVRELRLERSGPDSIDLLAPFRDLGLQPGEFGWRPLNGRSDPEPIRRSRVLRPQLVGCTPARRQINFSGPSSRKRIALTFDDGPSADTREIIRILDEHDARGTFFVLGSEVDKRPAALRRMARRGHEIGNHSVRHQVDVGRAELAEAGRAIEAASGFRPCAFRPPFGRSAGRLTRAARSLRMSVVLWDVDTGDWQAPGPEEIASEALAAGPGSIVLMHDGGGERGQTIAALPRIVRTLKRRGYELVAVTELLGGELRWRP